MSQQPQMNMPVMGGPVGGGMAGLQMNAGSPSNQPIDMSPANITKKLNTAIYDYLLRSQNYDVAKAFKDKMPIETRNLKDEKQANGVDEGLDEQRDQGIINRPDGLPLPGNLFDGPVLQDWWCQFWEIWHGQRGRGKNGTMQYIQTQRFMQKGRTNMMAMDPNMNMRPGYMQMGATNNGMGMAGPTDMRKAAMAGNNQQRNLTPQQMQAMKMQNAQQNAQMMQGNAMERQGSQVDGSGPRSGSPGSGDGPSSPKRQRIEGNMQQMNAGRPGQPGMQGNQVGPLSDPPPPDPAQYQHTLDLLREKGIDPAAIPAVQLQNLSRQPTNQQTQTVEVYSQSIKQSMQQQMQNVNNQSNVNPKGMNPNMGPGGAQGSPMNQPGMDGNEFYGGVNGRMAIPQNAAASAANQAGNNGNHALQDYQMQLMLLEQQNKKRLLMARQEQDMVAGHPGNVGPNGQFQAPGMSPQGSQHGANPSPNPNEMRGMIDPNQVPPAMRAQMVMGPNGQMMRPPTGHPMGANMSSQQLDAMRQQAAVQMPNGQFAGQPTQAQMMAAQQGAQAGQPGAQPLGTPRQANNMPPPPAPPANAGGTGPSSPSQQSQPPPTPNQNSKAKPGNKKEPANKKGAANKKGGNAGATPATETEQPPTPTAAAPATPMNSFAHKQNQQLPNGAPGVGQANTTPNNQPGGPNQQQQNAVAAQAAQQQQQQPPDLGLGFMDDGSFNNLDLGFPLGEDNLDTFDFDSFLNNDSGDFAFDVNVAFDGDPLAMEGGN